MREPASTCQITTAVLDAQDTPCVVLEAGEGTVVLANRGANRLLGYGKASPGGLTNIVGSLSVDLPIVILEYVDNTKPLIEILEECWRHRTVDSSKEVFGIEEYEDFWDLEESNALPWFEVFIIQKSPKRPLPARLSVKRIEVETTYYYIVSISRPVRLKPQHPLEQGPQTPKESHLDQFMLQGHYRLTPPPTPIDDSTLVSTSARETLEERFSKLRDSVYSNDSEFTGFILSADETFAYPNFNGSTNTQPVPVNNVEEYFGRFHFHIYDKDFTEKLPLEEWPSIRLNRQRKNFKGRFGVLYYEENRRIVIEATGECLYDQQNQFIGGVVWIQKLGTQEEYTQKELIRKLSSFEMICDNMPHMVWTSMVQGECDYFSQAWYDFTGLTLEQSVGSGWRQALHPDDLPRAMDTALLANKDGSDFWESEARYRRHDGVYRWMCVRMKSVKDSAVTNLGRCLKWYGTLTDIDEIVKIRDEAEASHKHMINVLAQTDVSIFRINSDYKVTFLRGRMVTVDEIKEYGPNLEGVNVFELLNKYQPGGLPSFEAKLREAMQGEVPFTESEDNFKDNKVGKTRFVPDWSGQGEHRKVTAIYGCSIDITNLHERAKLLSENARLVSEEQVAREKSSLKSQFLAHMSHEVRTPIAGVIGMTDLLAETKLDSHQKELLDCVQISAHNLLIIVNDILDLSKIEAGHMQLEQIPFNLHELVHECGKVNSHTAQQKSLRFSCTTGNFPEHLKLLGDPGRIRQIISNLLTNAIKFTSEGSVRLSISMSESKKKARIEVEDTGIGMDDALLSRLFEPFRQGDSSTARLYGGTGLGLVISRNLAQIMGGQLELVSAPSIGTKAILTLPLFYAGRPQLVRHRTIPLRLGVAGLADHDLNSSMHILIVDDNTINQRIAATSVRKLGYTATTVSNGQEALDYLDSISSTIDSPPIAATTTITSSPPPKTPSAILMDVQMPVLDGYMATKLIRNEKSFEKFKDIPIIALTASAIKGDQEKCRKVGMDDYLSKPYPMQTLREKLERWTRKKSRIGMDVGGEMRTRGLGCDGRSMSY